MTSKANLIAEKANLMFCVKSFKKLNQIHGVCHAQIDAQIVGCKAL